MSLLLGCIADDYTGASDLANTLARNGLRTIQTIGLPAADLDLKDIDAAVVSFKSRSIPADEAVALAVSANHWLREHGAKHVLFKICSTFDSTDLGNIGPVTEALRNADATLPTLVTPAFPETGRTVYQGHLFVGSVPLNESPLKDHPLNPMHDANLVRVLARQSRDKVGLVPLSVVEQGVEAVRTHLVALASEGVQSAIIDAVFDRHLETIGMIALEAPTSTGASGLGLGLARALTASKPIQAGVQSQKASTPVAGHAAIIAGSCSQATLQQIEAVAGAIPTLRLQPEELIASPAHTVERALSWARPQLASGPVLIASSAPPSEVIALQARHGKESGIAIEKALAEIASGLVNSGVKRLVVAGGETSGATVDRLHVQAFSIGQEIAPGVPILEVSDQEHGAMLLALKSGNFGGRDFFSRALELMQ
ncbi:3-oxo-tetronate kinase [Beijerinckia indica]|uniref:3-oxo-tetronate kinase n=1 Tax=Beijerinckia indica subsp. indica (strain ATCC 9039 / DSM 1715 / NCIMB 8712) TaxID=395963 RepID=B2IFW9_BEII9|nr:3-oxo-tetronate kinase [Beijerinckia indica]ACB95708.1 type III effector Hrp-dependent outers [Beijerinckia indica subsp. indica ATCC 9039]